MAVDKPRPWVVCFVRDCYEAIDGKKHDVATGWIVEFEVELGDVEAGVRLLEEDEVVAMEMDLFLCKPCIAKLMCWNLQDEQLE